MRILRIRIPNTGLNYLENWRLPTMELSVLINERTSFALKARAITHFSRPEVYQSISKEHLL
jgi:hypothetical protein